MQAEDLVLRDVHVPAAPSLWPPAPGWWLLAAALLLVLAVLGFVRWRRARRLRARQHLFDQAAATGSSAQQLAAISELLRRAARQVDPGADKLQGDAWLRFLDGDKGQAFSNGAGRLLLEGGYRRDVPLQDLATVRALARSRFLELMAGKR